MAERCLVCGTEVHVAGKSEHRGFRDQLRWLCPKCFREWYDEELKLARATLAAHDAEVVRPFISVIQELDRVTQDPVMGGRTMSHQAEVLLNKLFAMLAKPGADLLLAAAQSKGGDHAE